MKSIKPGRGPSMMGGIGSVIAALFGVFWTVMTLRMGVPFMAVFGILFVVMAIVQAVYNFRNATGKSRYSSFDITDSREEPDPLNMQFGGSVLPEERKQPAAGYCPYCGAPVDHQNYRFCPICGEKLP